MLTWVECSDYVFSKLIENALHLVKLVFFVAVALALVHIVKSDVTSYEDEAAARHDGCGILLVI
jgi:hypothetical protein